MSDRLKDRIAARKAAEAALELLRESVAGEVGHYWKVIRDAAVGMVPATEQESKQGPMSDKEAFAFGRQPMPFGAHKGELVNTVPLARLDWYAGLNDGFTPDLIRYLQNENIRRELTDSLGDAEDEDVAAD